MNNHYCGPNNMYGQLDFGCDKGMHTGPTGVAGPTGPTGPNGPATFAYFSQVGVETIAPGAAMTFNQRPMPATLPSGIGFIAPSQITVRSPGVYEVKLYAMPENDITLAIHVNGVEAPLSRYTTATSAGAINLQTLINITTTPAVVMVVNADTQHDANIDKGALPRTVSASLMITKLS